MSLKTVLSRIKVHEKAALTKQVPFTLYPCHLDDLLALD